MGLRFYSESKLKGCEAMSFSFYPDEKYEAIVKFLNLDPEKIAIHIWSDESITIGDHDGIEYYVSEEPLDYAYAGEQDGFKIYQNVQYLKGNEEEKGIKIYEDTTL